MKKILFITSLSGKTVNGFMRSAILAAKKQGYDFHLAANFSDANMEIYEKQSKEMAFTIHHVPFSRNPLSFKNVKAKKILKNLIIDNSFDIIHCNTPIGGLLGRLIARELNLSNKIIYTAHGFHFYKGAPLKNWIFYYPIERWLGKYTNTLITINKEDYELALRKKMARKIHFTHGVGIDTNLFFKIDNTEYIYEKYTIPKNRKIILSVGELIKRKNHDTFLKIARNMKEENVHFVLCGRGREYHSLIKKANKFKLTSDKFTFINYVPFNEMNSLYSICDVFCLLSFQEGLPGVLLEAMSVSLPVVASDIRGNSDLVDNGKGGFLHNPTDTKSFVSSIKNILLNDSLSKKFAAYNLKKSKSYDLNIAIDELINVYREF